MLSCSPFRVPESWNGDGSWEKLWVPEDCRLIR